MAERFSLENIISDALDSDQDGSIIIKHKNELLRALKDKLGHKLYQKIQKKYHLDLEQANTMSLNDLRALLIGVITNLTPEDLTKNPNLYSFIKQYQADTQKIAQSQRQAVAKHMDKKVLAISNPITAFFLRVGKHISDRAIKANDLKDAFAGVRINKAFEEDIKTAATLDYARTYKTNYQENGQYKGISGRAMKRAMPDQKQRQQMASSLYLAVDLAYRNVNQGSIISLLDDDGIERLYTVHNIVHDKGLVCTAFVPYEHPQHPDPERKLDVKITFRGTFSKQSASLDLETTGAGSKVMRDNRLMLLDEVNKLVDSVQKSHPKQAVSLSIHGHSLGGSLAERFTSELHQAIFYQKTRRVPNQQWISNIMEDDVDDTVNNHDKTAKNFESRAKLNSKEMDHKDYSALAKLNSINTMAANSARLSEKEAGVAEGFIASTQRVGGPKQNLNYFKAKGDWVSQAGYRSIGGAFKSSSGVNVILLSKETGYGGVLAAHPILGHCDHPLMRYHDKNKQDASFSCYNNQLSNNQLKQKLSSGKFIPKHLQKTYAQTPTIVAEPLTWAKKHIAKARGKQDHTIKSYPLKSEAEKRNSVSKEPKKPKKR
ncbi:MAG: hypothetical protein JSS07_08990 [Proteobacteria bacterium]|nr:hypothetical protein [Pseudomonadota bacterium]